MNNLPAVTFSAAYSSQEPSSLTLAAAGLTISAIKSLFISRMDFMCLTLNKLICYLAI